MKKTIIIYIIFLTIIPTISHSHRESDFRWYLNKRFNFKIYLPASKKWKTFEQKLKKEYQLILNREKNTSITIRVLAFKGSPKSSNSWLKWYNNEVLKGTTRILEEKKDKNIKNSDSRLFLVEYKNDGVPILMRSMLTKINKYLIVIEARACFNQFYKYKNIFDSVMGSFQVLQEFYHKR